MVQNEGTTPSVTAPVGASSRLKISRCICRASDVVVLANSRNRVPLLVSTTPVHCERQLRAQLFLEQTDLPAEDGLGDAQMGGRARKTAGIGNRNEILDRTKLFHDAFPSRVSI
jgi:hypothetical protein